MMSTKNFSLLTNLDAALTGKCSKHSGVSTERENLADYLRRVIKEKNLTYRQVAERSGGRISHAAISDIISGKTKEIKSGTISTLAKGLGVPEEEIFAVIRGKSPTDNPDFKKWKFAALFDEAEQLTPEQMAKFEIIMEMARREVQRMIQEQDQQEQQEAPRRARRVPEITTAINAAQEKKKKRA